MVDTLTQAKWDKAAPTFDLMAGRGAEVRWRPHKERLFGRMGDGDILFMALGTGLDIAAFPPGKRITAIDISPAMLAVAAPRVAAYDGELEARVMDVHELEFDDNHFDQVFTSCTFCSVPDPVNGLRSLYRVMKPGAELCMFEHTGSRFYPFRGMMNLMSLLTEKLGPAMNRRTVDNVVAAGFELVEVNHIFLDVVKTIIARKPG
ncbi:class I SAM-dependent methyltransferase [Parahaliea mediterranea]|uniref:Class I SAM-dependent methyltransferase n=1 Tax=Parahaliea mediterranea TaxID=651086 RepID=A0A939DCS6_9GAMM|nr:class I SAM-dependent methyltransferase [Parahaliea mediterranea]MBN7795207.1 class I SAM-dependent methyltransferase [Parahaliea mediterranea]